MEKSFLQQEMNDHDYDEGHSKELACKVLTNVPLSGKSRKCITLLTFMITLFNQINKGHDYRFDDGNISLSINQHQSPILIKNSISRSHVAVYRP